MHADFSLQQTGFRRPTITGIALALMLAVGMVGFPANAGADISSGVTKTHGEAPNSALCQKLRTKGGTFSKSQSDLEKVLSGNWKAFQTLFVAYVGSLDKTARTVNGSSSRIPPNVRAAARTEIASGSILQSLTRKSKSSEELTVAASSRLPGWITAQSVVSSYVGQQCGESKQSSQNIFSGSSGSH